MKTPSASLTPLFLFAFSLGARFRGGRATPTNRGLLTEIQQHDRSIREGMDLS